MAVMDRVRRRQASQKAQTEAESQGGIPAPSSLVLAEPPHIARLKGVIGTLRKVIEANQDGSGLGRMAFVMTTFTDELAEELRDLDEIQIRVFMMQIGEVISWIGHGDNERLPDVVREFAEMVQPSPVKEDNGDAESDSYPELDTAAG
jgi:serine/threonine protein kinase HipA of HipAB toxin-antitoxin module